MGDRDRNRFRWAWWLLAYASLGVGIVGIFVPGLPTTVFVIAAAWAATRGSRRLERRLLAHPHFGPVILAWPDATKAPRIVVHFPTKAGALYFSPLRKNWCFDL